MKQDKDVWIFMLLLSLLSKQECLIIGQVDFLKDFYCVLINSFINTVCQIQVSVQQLKDKVFSFLLRTIMLQRFIIYCFSWLHCLTSVIENLLKGLEKFAHSLLNFINFPFAFFVFLRECLFLEICQSILDMFESGEQFQ